MTWLKATDPASNEIVAAAGWMVWPSSSSPTSAQLEAEIPGSEPSQAKHWPDKIDVTWILPGGKGLYSSAGSDDQEYIEWIMEEFFGRRREDSWTCRVS